MSGKVAIVTGGAQGIGAAYAKALVAEGAKVCVVDILDTSEIVELLNTGCDNAVGVSADVTDTKSVQNMVDETKGAFDQADILVHNAALFAGRDLKPFSAIPDDDWDRVMDINISGLFKCCRAVLPHMQQQGGGDSRPLPARRRRPASRCRNL